MQLTWKIYVVATVVCVVSFVAAWVLPTNDVIRNVIALPGVGALFMALFQLLRDEAAHVRALEIHDKQQLFNLGVTSHMANVAFDKHVEFSEKYIRTMQEGLTELFRTGPPGESLRFSQDLQDIRLSFRAWLTGDVQAKIMPFESALREMGVIHIGLEGTPPGPDRSSKVDQIYKRFSDVAGIEHEGHINEELAPGRIMDHLQALLGVEQLCRLRKAVIEAAINTLEKSSS
jgi:hypothetical protein